MPLILKFVPQEFPFLYKVLSNRLSYLRARLVWIKLPSNRVFHCDPL